MICVGWVNVGRHRSTRDESGATFRPPVSGCGIGTHVVGSEGADHAAAQLSDRTLTRAMLSPLPSLRASAAVFMTTSIVGPPMVMRGR